MLSSGEWDREIALEADDEEPAPTKARSGRTLGDLLNAFLPRADPEPGWEDDLVDLEADDET